MVHHSSVTSMTKSKGFHISRKVGSDGISTDS